jgi:hypothetical protein
MAKRQLAVGILLMVTLCAFSGRIATGATASLGWNPSVDQVAGYNIWCVATSNNQTNVMDVGNVTNAAVVNLLAGETYQFFATAYDASGLESDPSNTVNWVASANSAPSIAAIAPQTVEEGRTLSFQVAATDDGPAGYLRFSLGAGAPSGAVIDPMSGSFSWRPSSNQAPSTNVVRIIVADNGSPPLTASTDVTIKVLKVFLLNIGSYSGGIVQMAPSTPKWPEGYRYLAGTSVQLTATPNLGVIFLGWDVDGQRVKTNPLSLSMNRNWLVTPRFSGGGTG